MVCYQGRQQETETKIKQKLCPGVILHIFMSENTKKHDYNKSDLNCNFLISTFVYLPKFLFSQRYVGRLLFQRVQPLASWLSDYSESIPFIRLIPHSE